MEPLNLSASAMDSLTQTARLGSQAATSRPRVGLGLQLKAMPPSSCRACRSTCCRTWAGLAAAARLGEATGINVWSSSPCSSNCPVGKLF